MCIYLEGFDIKLFVNSECTCRASFMTPRLDVLCCILCKHCIHECVFNVKSDQLATGGLGVKERLKLHLSTSFSVRPSALLLLESVRWRHDDRCPLLKSVWLIWLVGNESCSLAQRVTVTHCTRQQSPHRSVASASHFKSSSWQAGMGEEMEKLLFCECFKSFSWRHTHVSLSRRRRWQRKAEIGSLMMCHDTKRNNSFIF